jgi:NADH dehydrogenase [ubiquinone] 1 alpha subcomplex assembly factor 1
MGLAVAAEQMMIFDFGRADAVQRWQSIDDGVMGGRSASQLRIEDGVAVFTGMVSLENNGGFASVRSAPGQYDLGTYAGIALRVRGDGKRYQLNLRTDTQFDGVNYRATFATEAGQWLTLRLPFSEFLPSFRGQQLKDAAPLDTRRIVTFGLLIADQLAGPFRLELEWLGGYLDSPGR